MVQKERDIAEDIKNELENFGLQVARYENKEIPEEKFKRYRLQNGIYGQRQAGHQMVRVKIPTGRLNTAQLRCLAEIAEKYSIDLGHVTTRQDIQFHYVDLKNVQSLMRSLAAVGLTTREACGNTVRNVTSCHRAGVCPTELFDVSDISEKVAYYLLWNPINQDLPRKFKISFSGCTTECGLAAIQDIGFVAAKREVDGQTQLGFKVFIGGGLGSHPKLAQLYTEFIPINEVFPLCEATLKLFDTHGNRRNKSKARMKFIIEKWGLDEFKAKLGEELAALKASGRTFPDLPLPRLKEKPLSLSVLPNADGDTKQFLKTNLLPQADGTFAVQIKLPLGDITAAQLRGLADITEQFSTKGARTTHQQNIIIPRVTQEQILDFFVALQKIGLAEAGAEKVVDVLACPGAATCQLALTASMGVGAAINQALAEGLPDYDDLEGVRIRISGCPNSCGHHHISGIGLHGVAKKINGVLVPHYQFHLGGKIDGNESVIGKSKIKLPAKNIPAAILELIRLFRAEQQQNENFNQFIDRLGREVIGEKLSHFTQLPPFEEQPDLYRDWGEDEKVFSLDDLGPGECSGTVIDMIEYGLRMAGESIESATASSKKGDATATIEFIQKAILYDARSLLYTYGTDSPHDDQILKEFQQKVVEQAILSDRFEIFTEDLGKWADFGQDAETVRPFLKEACAFVKECQEAYDHMDASMKLVKK